MSDAFRIIPPVVRAEGKDVPPEQIQAALNSLSQQTTIALNSVASDPTGPAGGDLSGNYPNPTVTGSHITSGTISGVAVTASMVDSTSVGGTTPSTGAFTTLTATTPVGVASGGTGQNTLSAHNVLLGEGTSGVGFASPSTAGKMLISQGAAVDPAFANNPAIIAGTIDNTPVGATTPSTGAFTTLTATTPVGVPSGGTGRATLTAHAVLVGETASAINQVGPGTTGQMLIGVTGADPAFGNTVSTLTATGAITPSSTNGIVGTTTNDNANSGSIGEYATAVGTNVSLTSGTSTNVTSISLTAGDWDVSGNVVFSNTGGMINNASVSVGTTSATLNSDPDRSIENGITVTTGATLSSAAPVQRISIASTTTVYLVANSTFGGTETATGRIRARRIR